MNELAIGYSISEFNSLSTKWQKFWEYLVELKKHLENSLANRGMKLCVAKQRTIKWIEFLFWPNIFEWIKWAEYLKIIKAEEESVWKYNETYEKLMQYIDRVVAKQFVYWRWYFEELWVIMKEKVTQVFWEGKDKIAIFWQELWEQLNTTIIERFEEDMQSRQRIHKLRTIVRKVNEELIREWNRRRKRLG